MHDSQIMGSYIQEEEKFKNYKMQCHNHADAKPHDRFRDLPSAFESCPNKVDIITGRICL